MYTWFLTPTTTSGGSRPLTSTTSAPITPLGYYYLHSLLSMEVGEGLDSANLGFDFGVDLIEQGACVENVIESVIASLLDDQNRKFIYVEMVRFSDIQMLFFLFFVFVW